MSNTKYKDNMNAVIYIRVSTIQQNTDRQYAELEQYATSRSYKIVEKYEDQISGFKDENQRPSLSKLIEDAKTNKFDVILFSELSRLSRQTSKTLELINYFRDECHKEMYFQKQNIFITNNKNDLGSELLLSVLSTVSSYEIELAAERQQGGKIAAVKKRCWTHGQRPFGFDIDENKHLHINKEESVVIREMYSMYRNGFTSVQIAHCLNNKGIIAPSSKNVHSSNFWHPGSVCQILRAKRNIGIFEAKFYAPEPKNKEVSKKRMNRKLIADLSYEDKALAIISDEEFYTVNQMIDSNIQNKDTAKKNVSLLKKLLVCGNCGSNFYYKMSGKKFSYSCFGGRYSFSIGKKKCDKSLSISAEKIDGLIVAMAKSKLFYKRNFESTSDKISNLECKIKQNESVISSNEILIANINADFNKYLKHASKYNIDEDEIEKEFQYVEKQKNKLFSDVEKLKKEIVSLKKQIKMLNKEMRFVTEEEYKDMKVTELKNLFEEYIDKIELFNSKQWIIIHVIYLDGENEFAFLRKKGNANKLLHYANIVKTLISENDFKYLEEHDLLEKGKEVYYYPYCQNIDESISYNNLSESFIVFGKEYTINEFICSIYPKSMNEFMCYEYFDFNRKFIEENNE